MLAYQLMIARFANGIICRSTLDVIHQVQDANGSPCEISPFLTVSRDAVNGYYVAADVGARYMPTYSRVSDYFASVFDAARALESIGRQNAAEILDNYNLW